LRCRHSCVCHFLELLEDSRMNFLSQSQRIDLEFKRWLRSRNPHRKLHKLHRIGSTCRHINRFPFDLPPQLSFHSTHHPLALRGPPKRSISPKRLRHRHPLPRTPPTTYHSILVPRMHRILAHHILLRCKRQSSANKRCLGNLPAHPYHGIHDLAMFLPTRTPCIRKGSD
jgi:hypothetical protein